MAKQSLEPMWFLTLVFHRGDGSGISDTLLYVSNSEPCHSKNHHAMDVCHMQILSKKEQ